MTGSNIGTWRDKSGNGRDATQGTLARQPTYESTGVRFISSNQTWLNIPQSWGTAFLGNSPFHVFIVATQQTGDGYITGQAGAFGQVLFFNHGALQNYANYLTASLPVGPGTASVLDFQYTGAGGRLFQNGTSYGSNASALTLTAYNGPQIGRRYGAAGTTAVYHDQRFYEIIGFFRVLPPAERQLIEGYLSRKWRLQPGLSVFHPFNTVPPTLRRFAPIDISGCALWLDAADPATLTLSGNTVTAWNDKSGNNRTVTVVGTPQLLSGGLNTTPVITLDGSSYFTTSTVATLGTGNYTLCAVWNQTTNVTSVPIGIEGGGNGVGIGWNSNGFYNLFEYGSNDASLGRTFSTAPVIQIGSRVSGSINLHLNGTVSRSIASSKNVTNPNVFVGRYGNAAGPFPVTGYLGEILVFTGPTTVVDRQQLEGYLARKWGLGSSMPATQPYRFGLPPLVAGFTPLAIPGCAFWLDAVDSSTVIVSGSDVTQWRDKSGNGFHATVSSNAYAVTSPTGLSFTNSYYTTSYSAAPANETFFTVFTAPATLAGLAGGLIGTQTGGRTIIVPGFGGVSNSFGVNASAVSGGAGVTGITPNTRFLGVIQITGTSTTAAINGNPPSAPVVISGFTGGTTTTLGRETTTQYPFNGVMHELLAYTASLTTPQRQVTEGYLAWKWGLQSTLPGTHPYRLIKP